MAPILNREEAYTEVLRDLADTYVKRYPEDRLEVDALPFSVIMGLAKIGRRRSDGYDPEDWTEEGRQLDVVHDRHRRAIHRRYSDLTDEELRFIRAMRGGDGIKPGGLITKAAKVLLGFGYRN